jgi:hypothetical protein
MTSPSATGQGFFAWLDGVAVAATVCNRQGVCLYLNDHAARTFAKAGGRDLLGQNLLDCHDEPARSRFAAQLNSPTPNTYTIEREGRRKIIHHVPRYSQRGLRPQPKMAPGYRLQASAVRFRAAMSFLDLDEPAATLARSLETGA